MKPDTKPDTFAQAVKAQASPLGGYWDNDGNVRASMAGSLTGGAIDSLAEHMFRRELGLGDFM